MSEIAAAGATRSGAEVQRAISHASRETGVRFDFLLDQARQESGLRPDARASTSSATGLYQFIDQTWLRLVREQGPRHGMAQEAAAIAFDGQRYGVADGAAREHILGLRLDPTANALMAGEYARENYDRLDAALGRPVMKTDLSIAHFLGGDGATRFLRAMDRDGSQPAAPLFPSAAGANRPVFYRADGSERSLSEIYQRFERHGTGGSPEQPGPPPPGLGHFMAALPDGRVGAMLTAPRMSPGGNLWQVLTHPSDR